MPNELGLVLYPNPASSQIYLDHSGYLKLKSISVYDMTGRTVKSLIISKDSQVSIDVSDLSTGSYIFEVSTSEGKKIIQRFFVN